MIRVVLREKETPVAGGLDALAGEFENELLHHSLRLRVSAANQRIREYVVARALASAEGVQASAGAAPTGGPNGSESVLDAELEKEIEKLLAEVEKSGGGDPLKIEVPREAPKAGAAPAKKGARMILRFDARLYSRDAVERAVEAWSGVARFSVREQAGMIDDDPCTEMNSEPVPKDRK